MPSDRRLLFAVTLLVIAVVGVSGAQVIGPVAHPEPSPQYLQVSERTNLWAYTSHSPRFEARTLAINLVVYGEPAALDRYLRERAFVDWNETDEEIGDVDPVEGQQNGTLTAWGAASGGTRYTYVSRPGDRGGRWMTESYQLHRGDYFGARHHIRAYESPYADEQWVALQAHHEHWDWFRLRHTVDGVRNSQRFVEQEFMDRRFVADLSREYAGSDQGPSGYGWVTVIEFEGADVAAIALIFGVPVLRRIARSADEATEYLSDRTFRMAMLAGGVVGLYLTVRFGAIGLERVLPIDRVWIIAAVGSPVLLLGLPVVASLFARRLDTQAAFTGATVGFVTAILLDYTYLQVTVLPLDTLVHRLTLAIALGAIAAGSAWPERIDDEPRGYLRLGLLLWLVAVGMPLFRFV